MKELKLAEYREANRRMGWRATADIIARHIITQSQEPLDFDVLGKRFPDDYTVDPLTRCKIRDVKEFSRRLEEAVAIIMYSFDDSKETAFACVRHLVFHHCIFTTGSWRFVEHFRATPTWQEFLKRHDKLFDLDLREFDSRFF